MNRSKQSLFRSVVAKTENQKNFIRCIIENDIIFCTGPSGTGKSFISAGIAAQKLAHDDIDQIVITRPLVATGNEVGALPGELYDKIKPYFKPMEQNLKYFLGPTYGIHYNESRILYDPIELMRGATYHNSYMILDEAQNCTFEQIKMFISRMGKESKVLINGDVDQSDLRHKSGLSTCMERLENVERIGAVELKLCDIQRNGLLAQVLYALGQ